MMPSADVTSSPTSVSGLQVAGVICRRDLTRFVRQPARIAAAIGTPLMLWLLVGSGFAGSFKPAGLGEVSYAAFLLPGMMTLTAVFTAIFSAISVIDARNEGWLQGVLVAPVPRWSIALGKIASGSIVAFLQSAVLLCLIPFMGVRPGFSELLMTILALAATCFAMAGMGVALAWRSETSASFHAVMNLVFMPMWLLSGAFFPPDGAASWLSWIMNANPLTWCTLAIRQPMLGEPQWLPLVICVGFAMVMLVLATMVVSRRVVLR